VRSAGSTEYRNIPTGQTEKRLRQCHTNAMVKYEEAVDRSEWTGVFTDAVQYAAVPLLIGTLLSSTPTDQPSTLLLSMSDGITPEVTLHLTDNNGRESHLNGPLMPGSQIQFEGIPVSFTQNPFMLTFDVTTDPKRQKLRTSPAKKLEPAFESRQNP